MTKAKRKPDATLVIAFAFLSASMLFVFFPYSKLDGLEFGNFKIDINLYSNLGQFVGGIASPFVSIAAFILLYKTYMSQKEELASTKDILDRQQFETTFFNMLNLHHSMVNQTEVDTPLKQTKAAYYELYGIEPKTHFKGKECFKLFHSKLKEIYSDGRSISDFYSEFFKDNEAELGHYFRNLYHIFKLIKRAKITDKQSYASLVRAQLSSYELALIFYNCMSSYGEERFLPLVLLYELKFSCCSSFCLL